MGLISAEYPLSSSGWRSGAASFVRSQVCQREAARAVETGEAPSGVATFPRFLSKEALQNAAEEARAKAEMAFVSSQTHNAYLLPQKDTRFALDHVRNREMMTTVASVACDELDPRGALHKLYFGQDGDHLIDLLSQVVGKRMYRLGDKLGAVSINVFKPGMEHAWHFDESEYTVTICLQKAEKGGEFVFSPPIRKNADDLAEESVLSIMDGSGKVRELEFEPGTLSIFCGQRSLHRVAKVEGGRDRLVAVLCFSSQPGVCNSANVQKQFWGRSLL